MPNDHSPLGHGEPPAAGLEPIARHVHAEMRKKYGLPVPLLEADAVAHARKIGVDLTPESSWWVMDRFASLNASVAAEAASPAPTADPGSNHPGPSDPGLPQRSATMTDTEYLLNRVTVHGGLSDGVKAAVQGCLAKLPAGEHRRFVRELAYDLLQGVTEGEYGPPRPVELPAGVERTGPRAGGPE